MATTELIEERVPKQSGNTSTEKQRERLQESTKRRNAFNQTWLDEFKSQNELLRRIAAKL